MAADTPQRGPGRPPAASREDVERIALELMLRDGYDAVSVDAIAAAAGIGRTTFFRYFGSKPGVVWAPFDATLAWLREGLAVADAGSDTLDTVRTAIVSSTRSAVFSSDVWLERFQLLDSHPSLRADAHEHWENWKQTLASHIAESGAGDANDPVPMAIAGACHGVFLAELRNWRNTDDARDALIERLGDSLTRVCEALRPLVPPQ
jgi:AcrR family transcriptional regulator